METWFIILISLCITTLLAYLLNPSKTSTKRSLPPGPPSYPLVGNLLWLRRSFFDLEPTLRSLHALHGPLITLRIGPKTLIFISSRAVAYQALVEASAVFAGRPAGLPTARVMNNNPQNISSSTYGPNWRLLRRNLTAGILHQSRSKSYSAARERVVRLLIRRLSSAAAEGGAVPVADHFPYAMFYLLSLMCFGGDELEERRIREIEDVQRRMLSSINRFNILNLWPKFGKILFRSRWKELLDLCENQKEVLLPLIRARIRAKQEMQGNEDMLTYVDTLKDLELPVEMRKLDEGEMVSLCSEFLTAGVDTTTAVLQWIMANLVKYPHIQNKVFAEINGVFENGERDWVREEDLQKMPYLKAVVLEGLRRHPPGHLLVPHSVTKDVELGGYFLPKDTTVNFMVADMGWDPEVWDDPMAFKPERFLSDGGDGGGDGGGGELFDVTGSRGIKMMPFGAGRRICPGYGLAMLHLEYIVGNLVWAFEWEEVEGAEVDLSEKQEFAIVMKNALTVHLSPRSKMHHN
ncbi:cytochrome P450 89A2-like [Malania oleifera]|uniref:cytochrome P450 89A2-like n=1 Tax=Malania oleifera TaxID=397392 RepID=UPI0025ADE8B6|nr:cytochrome P450 89A2-like [Malania oleifera]